MLVTLELRSEIEELKSKFGIVKKYNEKLVTEFAKNNLKANENGVITNLVEEEDEIMGGNSDKEDSPKQNSNSTVRKRNSNLKTT